MKSYEAPQQAVVAFLSEPQTYDLSDGDVEVIETHISRVFLAGERALKMKRAVKFPYLDFTSLESRRHACEAEVVVNRRTAPQIYRGTIAVTRERDGQLALGGNGPVIEWLVDMNRFDQAGLFDHLVQEGKMRRHPMIDLADHIAAFHDAAEVRYGNGGAAGTGIIIDNIISSFRDTGSMLEASKIDDWSAISSDALNAHREILDARRQAGRVRHCHGDMHLRNICMIDGKPVLFDGIEFNADFSEIDTLYDLAFLLMDLDSRGHRRLANVSMNRYFDVTGEVAEMPGAMAVLPLFLSMRAAVRAHVDATQAMQFERAGISDERRIAAVHYLDMAIEYLRPEPARLVAVGGLSGGGKSRMARELAPYLGAAPGARVVRTDAVRKRIAGVQQETRLGSEGYTDDMHERTYTAFYEEARLALEQGQAVVADAVFPSQVQRMAIETFAAEAEIPFHGLWIEAAEEVRVGRVKARQRNISDVTEEIAREQSGYDLGEITWTRVDSAGPKDATIARGKHALGIT